MVNHGVSAEIEPSLSAEQTLPNVPDVHSLRNSLIILHNIATDGFHVPGTPVRLCNINSWEVFLTMEDDDLRLDWAARVPIETGSLEFSKHLTIKGKRPTPKDCMWEVSEKMFDGNRKMPGSPKVLFSGDGLNDAQIMEYARFIEDIEKNVRNVQENKEKNKIDDQLFIEGWRQIIFAWFRKT